MHTRPVLVLLVMSTLLSSGCYTELTIPLEQAPLLDRRALAMNGGDTEVVSTDELESLEPVAPEGAKFVRADGDRVVLEAETSPHEAADVGVYKPFKVDFTSANGLTIIGESKMVIVDAPAFAGDSFRSRPRALRGRRYSPSKTAGLCVGVTLGAIAGVVGTLAAAIAASSGSSGHGGWLF